jgi:HEAT repeat protein
VAIRASFSQQIDKLVGDLGRDDVAREAAVARLIVLGSRGVERLVALAVSGAPPAARAAAFRALEGIGDPRAVDPAVRSTSDDDATVAVAAITASPIVFTVAPECLTMT